MSHGMVDGLTREEWLFKVVQVPGTRPSSLAGQLA